MYGPLTLGNNVNNLILSGAISNASKNAFHTFFQPCHFKCKISIKPVDKMC